MRGLSVKSHVSLSGRDSITSICLQGVYAFASCLVKSGHALRGLSSIRAETGSLQILLPEAKLSLESHLGTVSSLKSVRSSIR